MVKKNKLILIFTFLLININNIFAVTVGPAWPRPMGGARRLMQLQMAMFDQKDAA